MESSNDQADAILRDRVLRARQMDPSEKLSAGFELFEYACEITRAGIRNENPQVKDAEVERILAQRLKLGRRLEIGQWKSRT
jgi:hypothetical protein